jgi:hypothetical protein
MTARQKLVVWIWILFVAAMGIFPPWHTGGVNTAYSLGYRFIFTSGYGRVDTSRLFVEWAMATVVAAGFCFAWPVRPIPPAAPAKP